jgi:hypothetical protein
VGAFFAHGQREAGLVEIETVTRIGGHGVGRNVRGLIGLHLDERERRWLRLYFDLGGGKISWL